MSLLSRSPIIMASEARTRRAELEIECYSNIGTTNVLPYCVKHFVSLKSGRGGSHQANGGNGQPVAIVDTPYLPGQTCYWAI
jgi:hypothetical protein